MVKVCEIFFSIMSLSRLLETFLYMFDIILYIISSFPPKHSIFYQNVTKIHLRWETVSGCGCVARKLSLSDQWGRRNTDGGGRCRGKGTAAAQGKRRSQVWTRLGCMNSASGLRDGYSTGSLEFSEKSVCSVAQPPIHSRSSRRKS